MSLLMRSRWENALRASRLDRGRGSLSVRSSQRRRTMSIGLILVILLVIFLLGGFSGRFGGYGYGYGHGGMGILGVILIVVIVLLVLGRL